LAVTVSEVDGTLQLVVDVLALVCDQLEALTVRVDLLEESSRSVGVPLFEEVVDEFG
jgi:hypothetical protein